VRRLSCFKLPCNLENKTSHGRFQLQYSYMLFFQVCILSGLLGDDALKVVTVRNCCNC
jgi:hypothetical protein